MHEDGSVSVNGYKLGAQLGAGAYGRVLKATKHGETFAVKVIQRSLVKQTLARPPSLKSSGGSSSSSSGGLEAVLREVAVMKALEHINLVKLFAFIDDPQRSELYIVMEYVEGGTLARCIVSARSCRRRRLFTG